MLYGVCCYQLLLASRDAVGRQRVKIHRMFTYGEACLTVSSFYFIEKLHRIDIENYLTDCLKNIKEKGKT